MATQATSEFLGRPVVRGVRYLMDVSTLVYLALRSVLFEQRKSIPMVFKITCAQIYYSGWQAMPLISVIAFATGGVVILNGMNHSTLLGSDFAGGELLYKIVVRELAPLITALVIVARSGTAVASELGNMKANKEIDALNVLSIDPIGFTVSPRVVGGVISLFCLVFYFNLLAIFGGFLLSSFGHDLALSNFLLSIVDQVTPGDMVILGLKNLCNGLIIFGVACYRGLAVQRSSHEVPQAATKAVVVSITFVVILSFFISAIWNLREFYA